jgi:hypothetical protein
MEIENPLNEAHGPFFWGDIERRIGGGSDKKQNDGPANGTFPHDASFLQKIFAEKP